MSFLLGVCMLQEQNGQPEHCHKFGVTCEINEETHVREPIVS